MFKPPPHNRTVCLGITVAGHHEPCDRPVEEGSVFPFCRECRTQLEATPLRRQCSGSITYDFTMRPSRIECENFTGHPEEALCASCRVIDKRERARFKNQTDTCPTCGQHAPHLRR